MNHHREVKDRRRHNRYRLQHGAYAAFTPHFIKLGPIVNISLSGFACQYFIDKDQNKDPYEPFVSLRNNAFIVQDLPVMVICNFEMNMEESRYLKMMYCGVQFGQLSFEQFKALDDFIIYNTVEILSDRRASTQRRKWTGARLIPDLPRYHSFDEPLANNRRVSFERRKIFH